MHATPSEAYRRYLERCARSSSPEAPLDMPEFENVLRRLDELYLTGLERHLTCEERDHLIELRRLLREDIDELLDAGETAPRPVDSARTLPGSSRMGARCPDAENRRELWRQRRRAGG